MDETYASAVLHYRAPGLRAGFARSLGFSGHRVLGRYLRPFSRWHAAQLDFIESPFLGHKSRPSSFLALYDAVRCCRLVYPKRITPRTDLMARFDRIRSQKKHWRNHIPEINAFAGYMADYNSRPELVVDSESEGIKLPWYLYEVASLVQLRLRLTGPQKNLEAIEAWAWNLPLGESSWWLTAHAAAAGAKIDIVTPEDRAQLAERAKRRPAHNPAHAHDPDQNLKSKILNSK